MSGSRRVDTSDVKASRPNWLRGQKYGLDLKLLASASSIWPHLTSLPYTCYYKPSLHLHCAVSMAGYQQTFTCTVFAAVLFLCLFTSSPTDVCLYVILTVRPAYISQKPNYITQNFPYTLPMAVARSSSANSAICYVQLVLLVLWIISRFHMMGNGAKMKCDVGASSSPGAGTSRASDNIIFDQLQESL